MGQRATSVAIEQRIPLSRTIAYFISALLLATFLHVLMTLDANSKGSVLPVETSQVLHANFAMLEEGLSANEVMAMMGEPKTTRTMKLRMPRTTHELYARKTFMGPARALFNKLPEGTKFEQWSYVGNDARYYVYLSIGADAEQRVIHTATVDR